MDALEKKISKELQELTYEHLFKSKLQDLLKSYLIRPRHLTRLAKTLEETLKTDTEYFWLDVCRSNLLTFLYIKLDDPDLTKKAVELNDECLKREPNNINGFACKVVLLVKKNKFVESQKVLAESKALAENETSSTVAIAEIAYCLQYFGPFHYLNAIQKYETVLKNVELFRSNQECSDKVVMWKFHLAQIYCRLLNKGNLEEKLLNMGGNLSETTSRIFALLNEVSETKHRFYCGKAFIEMADAVKKCETSSIDGTLANRPALLSSDEYVKNALEVAPNDVYVLERTGRHYRQRATNSKEFFFAIDTLKKALKICPSRHVACHQISLAYRCAWLYIEKHEEARIFTNTKKQGNKSPNCLEADAVVGGNSQAAESNADNTKNTQPALNSRTYYQTKPAPPAFPTVPTRTRQPGHVQEQKRKKPDYFDILRVSNPKCKKPKHLMNALKYLQIALEYSPTSSRYHIDLGRLYISLDRNDDARSCFENAKKDENFMDDNDTAYLYEQWGILEEKLKSDTDDVKLLYRKAMVSAVKAKVRSRIAFYNLRDILFQQIKEVEEGEANQKIILECELLYKTMEQYGKSKEYLRKAQCKDETNVKLTWKLIRTLYSEQIEADVEDAFRYIEILASTAKLDEKADDDDEDDKIPNRRRIVLEVMKQVMKKETKATNLVFDWLIGGTTQKVEVGKEMTEECDVCVLMTTSLRPSTEYARRIVDILKDLGNLSVESSDDIGFGKNPRVEMNNMVHRSKAVIVVVDQGGESWEDILLIVEETLLHGQLNVCLVCDNDSDSQPTQDYHFRQKWPRFTFDDKLSDETIICELFRLMLDTSPPSSDK